MQRHEFQEGKDAIMPYHTILPCCQSGHTVPYNIPYNIPYMQAKYGYVWYLEVSFIPQDDWGWFSIKKLLSMFFQFALVGKCR